jgi:hypothetical protein
MRVQNACNLDPELRTSITPNFRQSLEGASTAHLVTAFLSGRPNRSTDSDSNGDACADVSHRCSNAYTDCGTKCYSCAH